MYVIYMILCTVCVCIMFQGIIYVKFKSCNLTISCVYYHSPPPFCKLENQGSERSNEFFIQLARAVSGR